MANQSVQTVSSFSDKAKVYGALLLAILSVVASLYLDQQGALIKWGSLFAGLLVSLVLFLFSELGKELLSLFRDAWRELKKVVWPTRKEALHLTLYVFVFVVLMAIVIWIADKALEWVLYDLVLGWRK